VRVLAYIWAGPWSLVGLLLSPFFARRRVSDGILVCEGARWPGRLGWNYSAITFGHVVLSIADVTPLLLRHEVAHVRQYERWGPFFIPAYLIAAVWARLRGGSSHFDNAFEVAARSRSGGPGA
jgi:hypothetical protein